MSAAEKLVVLTEDQVEALVRKAVKAEFDVRASTTDVLTTEGAGKLLDLDPKTVAKYAASGKLPAHPLGPEWRFLRSELLQWLKDQKR